MTSTTVDPRPTFTALRRDRVADLVRLTALAVVVVWHSTLSLFHRDAHRALTIPNPIGRYHGLWLLTWLLQVMPLFFVVSGAVNADSWDRHRRRGGGTASFAARRAARFVQPLAVLAVLCGAAEATARLTGYGPLLARHWVVLVPLWTLALLVAYAPLTPWLHRQWTTNGVTFTAALAGTIAVSDLVRFRGHVVAAGYVSTGLVWLFAYHLGWVYRSCVARGAAACRDTGRVLTVVGLAGLVLTTNLGPYPRSMVATTTDPISNLLPTTAAIGALALFQCGVLLLLRPRLARWLGRDRIWRRVEGLGRYAMAAYLLHMVAVVALVLVVEGAGLHLSGQPTALWWLTRPLWLGAVAAILVPVLRLTRRWA